MFWWDSKSKTLYYRVCFYILGLDWNSYFGKNNNLLGIFLISIVYYSFLMYYCLLVIIRPIIYKYLTFYLLYTCEINLNTG